MAHLRRISDGAYPVTRESVQALFPNDDMSAPNFDYTQFGFDTVLDTPKPVVLDENWVVEGNPVYDADPRAWLQQWVLMDVTSNLTQTEREKLVAGYKVKLSELIAEVRYEKETSGIMRQGFFISTDRTSQICLATALIGLQAFPEDKISWKTPTGSFVTADLGFISKLHKVVFKHVQVCRDYERYLYEKVQTIDVPSELVLFNYKDGWPV